MRITRTYTVTSETIADIQYAVDRRYYRSASDLIREAVRKITVEIKMKEQALEHASPEGITGL
jgi:Arc/MetJ-type ribon-helix-helix transcriptional regulator